MKKSVIESLSLGLNKLLYLTDEYVNKRVNEICSIPTTDKKSMLLKAISVIDLTSLNADDTRETIEELCAKAINPLGDKSDNKDLHTAAVCVLQSRVQDAKNVFKRENSKNIAIATVAGDFPTAALSYDQRLKDVIAAGQSDADEIDIVIDRSLVENENWEELFRQISEMRKACGDKHMKTILSTGDLSSVYHVYKAAMVAMSAGSNFIKTSTGKESVNATLEVGIVICEAIKEFTKWTGVKVGFKPAGGIKTSLQALQWVNLVSEILGEEWLDKKLFRIGASSLLDDLVEAVNNS
ncbi:deoxyribose-phosphate aldolase [Diachasma alloeum]|uniref:deoxyribose-phosphate aldolase n=1 Tax=Diachasma alloeum TaxID=454923 RepID=UPI0007381EB1|nr:deoxyribose-phosphate aldolase [Diachasma alloeum]